MPASSPPPVGETPQPVEPSSPLFFSSPQKSSPVATRRRDVEADLAERTGRMNLDNASTPLPYSSSPPPTSSLGGILSDLGSESQNTARNRNNVRGDIFSSDIRSPWKRHVDMPVSEREFSVTESEYEGNSEHGDKVIWGTNINVLKCRDTFKDFLQSFKPKYRAKLDDQDVEPGEGENLVYMEMLDQMRTLELTNFNLDMRNLLAYPKTKKMYRQLIDYPQEMIPILDLALKEVLATVYMKYREEFDDSVPYLVRPYGVQDRKGMRDLNPGDIDKIVAIKGLVIRATPVIPDMKQAFFKCSVCNHTTAVPVDRGSVAEPTKCPRAVCGQRNSMQMVHNRSVFADKQVIRLQETPDNTPDGQTPHSVSLCVYDQLVDACKAGDRIEVTGIFRSVPVRINPRMRTLKTLFKTYVDVVHVQKSDKKRMGNDISTLDVDNGGEDLERQMNDLQQQQQEVQETRRLTPEDEERIKETAQRPDVYELLARSLAPSIYEQDDVKKGILLQLFGGTNKTFEKGGSPRYRGDINILLCGDPSTSKSQILQYVHKIAPRGLYTSGKGSSAVGLTAYITRDVETKQLVLESGALVLSDGGVCCIDEFDKMSDATRSVLHEVMEQQTVSIAKAGIITTLNARTSILASANPIGSKYDTNLSVPQNIDLPPPLLSRFDLVYLMIDKIDEATDRQLATHLTSMYLEDAPENAAQHEILPVEFLTLYISYAKRFIKPRITPGAKKELVEAYVAMRKLGEDARTSEKRITATTRQLESMIRLSEAHAKMRLSSTVERDDVLEAVRLIRAAIKDYAMDPLTGTIDMDLVQTGTSSAQRRQHEDIGKHVLGLIDGAVGRDDGGSMRYEDLVRRVNETSENPVDANVLKNVVQTLVQEGKLTSQGSGARRSLKRIHGI